MENPSEICNTIKQCEVCEGPGNGCRYGAYACNACGVFLYNVCSRLTIIEPCNNNNQCSVLGDNHYKCRECRLRKCLGVGMRYPIYYNPLLYQGAFKNTSKDELLATVGKAHLETIHLIVPTLDPIRRTESMQNLSKSCCAIYSPHSAEVFNNAVKGVEAFAEKLFSYGGVPACNQDILWDAVFDVLLVRLARTYNPESNTLTCWNGQVVVKPFSPSSSEETCWKEVFDFAEMVYKLNLSDDEVSLFCLVIIVHMYYLDKKKRLIAEIYSTLMDKLTDFVNDNHLEDPTNFFTAFNILLFRIGYLKNAHPKLPRDIFDGANPSDYSSVPPQYTSQSIVYSKALPTFNCEQSGYQSLIYYPSAASVDKSIPNQSSSILSNTIVQYSPSIHQGFPTPPAERAEQKRKEFVPEDRKSSRRGGIEGSSELWGKKSCPGQDHKIIEVKKSKLSESGSSTDYSVFYNEGFQNIHLKEHFPQTAAFANPVDCPPISTEDSEILPLDLSTNRKDVKGKQDFFTNDA